MLIAIVEGCSLPQHEGRHHRDISRGVMTYLHDDDDDDDDDNDDAFVSGCSAYLFGSASSAIVRPCRCM